MASIAFCRAVDMRGGSRGVEASAGVLNHRDRDHRTGIHHTVRPRGGGWAGPGEDTKVITPIRMRGKTPRVLETSPCDGSR